MRAEVERAVPRALLVGGTRSWREWESTEGLFYSENPVIASTEGAVRVTTLGCALVYFLIFVVGENQTNPVLAVQNSLQQPV